MGPVWRGTTVVAVHNNLRPPQQSGNGRKRRRQKVKRTTQRSPEQRKIIDLVWARESQKKRRLDCWEARKPRTGRMSKKGVSSSKKTTLKCILELVSNRGVLEKDKSKVTIISGKI